MGKLKTIAIAALALCLAACGPMMAAMGGLAVPAPQSVQKASAPLAGTRVDENALRTLWRGLDAIRAGVDVLVARRALVRNSPAALRVQAGLIAAQDALNAASDLAALLNDPVTTISAAEIQQRANDYRAAIARARAAFDEINSAIRGG